MDHISAEIWSIINPTRGTHPIHLHLVSFRVLDRRPFDIARYQESGELSYTGPAVPPPPRLYPSVSSCHSLHALEYGNAIRIVRCTDRMSPRFSGLHLHALEWCLSIPMKPLPQFIVLRKNSKRSCFFSEHHLHKTFLFMLNENQNENEKFNTIRY